MDPWEPQPLLLADSSAAPAAAHRSDPIFAAFEDVQGPGTGAEATWGGEAPLGAAAALLPAEPGGGRAAEPPRLEAQAIAHTAARLEDSGGATQRTRGGAESAQRENADCALSSLQGENSFPQLRPPPGGFPAAALLPSEAALRLVLAPEAAGAAGTAPLDAILASPPADKGLQSLGGWQFPLRGG